MIGMKNKSVGISFVMGLIVLFLVAACSTEKNTFINRSYHSVTAKYNGYFNARELLRQGLEDYRLQAREDFTEILPIELLPNEEDVVSFYPIVDTAIVKCETVISKHSMPTSSKPSQKKSEHAKWIDQNWITIGESYYIRRDYDKALRSFKYVREFYTDRPSTYTGHLWMLKTEIQMGEMTNATRTLQRLEQRLLQINTAEKDESGSKKSKKPKSKYSKKTKSSKKDTDKIPKLPKNFDFEFAKVKAMYALAQGDKKKATEELKTALSKAKKKEDKARLSFIIGQLLQDANNSEARDYYTTSIKKNAPFEMSFNAKINRAVVSNLGDDQMVAELKKLAKEERYFEFRDQIYYSMSKIELGRPDRDQAKTYLTRSAMFSINNQRQKGISYETLGDLSLEDKNYVSAQRYYDSSAQVIPETYHNYELIKGKAEKLSKLVDNIDIIEFEDSVQMIASMGEKEREDFLKGVIKQLQKEEQERKEREAERAEQLRKLQQTYAKQNAKTGSKWYFGNSKAMQEGVDDFKRVWGQRENEDYWRLSNKPKIFTPDFDDLDSTHIDSLDIIADTPTQRPSVNDLTVSDLMGDIPLTDSAMVVSNARLLEALYNAGHIYQEQLDEDLLASEHYQRVIDKNIEDKHNVVSAFQLYKLNEGSSSEGIYKNYILNNYPNSDYANYLRDPDYFIKKKERDALALSDYLRSVTRYEQGLYYPVVLRAEKVIEEEMDNMFREQYFLLKAMAMGRLNPDKETLIPTLEQLIEEYPETETAERAKELIELIQNGIDPFEEFESAGSSSPADLYTLSSNEYYVLIMLDRNQSINNAANNFSSFNNEYFRRSNLSVSNQLYGNNEPFIMVKSFESAGEAQAYIKDIQRTQRHIRDYHSNEMFFISFENIKVMLQSQKLEEYRVFFESNYN